MHDYFSCTVCQAAEQRVAKYEAEAVHLAEQLKTSTVGERAKVQTAWFQAKGHASQIRVSCRSQPLFPWLSRECYRHT